MESYVLLGHFLNGIYIRIVMEINVTSISLFAENIPVHFTNVFKTYLQFDTLSKKINHFYSLYFQS